MEDKSVGTVIDWILENWKFLIIIFGLFGTVIKVFRKIDKFTGKVDKIATDIPEIKNSIESHSSELGDVKEDLKELKEYQERDSKRNYYIIKGVLSSLRGLQEIGVNGPTEETTREIEKYMMEQVTH